MNTRLVLVLALAIALTNCAKYSEPAVKPSQPSPVPSPTSSAPPDLTGASESELHEHVGKIVTLRGKFSMAGVVGPFILVAHREVYVSPKGNYSWGKEYRRLEGREVSITGTLGFEHFEPSLEQHPPDYFYFPAETAKIELVK